MKQLIDGRPASTLSRAKNRLNILPEAAPDWKWQRFKAHAAAAAAIDASARLVSFSIRRVSQNGRSVWQRADGSTFTAPYRRSVEQPRDARPNYQS